MLTTIYYITEDPMGKKRRYRKFPQKFGRKYAAKYGLNDNTDNSVEVSESDARASNYGCPQTNCARACCSDTRASQGYGNCGASYQAPKEEGGTQENHHNYPQNIKKKNHQRQKQQRSRAFQFSN